MCPGNTWREWVPQLIELVDKEEDDMPFMYHSPSAAVVDIGGYNLTISSPEHHAALHRRGYKDYLPDPPVIIDGKSYSCTDEDLFAVPDFWTFAPRLGNYTDAQARKAVKDRL